MLVRFVCLANSYKEGGRCVAGILLDKKNHPIMEDGRPKWIRPVSLTNHGEIPTEVVSHIKILTIVEINILDFVGQSYQSENALFDEDSIREVGNFPMSGLNGLCEEARPKIFGNKGKAVSVEHIDSLDHSLMLVRTTDFKVLEKINEYKQGTTQIRLAFSYNDLPYEFTITDPIFLQNYRHNHRLVDGVEEMFLTLSLAIEWQDWHHKLVAGIICAS